MDSNKVKPFDSFSAVYNILIWAGYYRLLGEHNACLKACHRLYRSVALVIVIVYNLQHIIFILKPNNPPDLRIEGLMTEIPQINLFAKVLTLTLYGSRIDKINKLLDDPMFAANEVEDEQYLLQNVNEMHRLSRSMNIFISFTAACWPVSHIVQRIRDNTTVVPFYVPFQSDTWTGYVMLCLMQVLPMLWIGYGHLALDCVIATYFAQAQVQLKMIKHNLTHLFDVRGSEIYKHRPVYKHMGEEKLYTNFVHIVKRYERLVWYIKEVNSVFNPSISLQFLTSSATICMVIYKLSETDVLSVQFVFLMALICILLIQVLLYCYYGNLVRFESESINTSLYLSEWRLSSPRFRGAMLIAMSRWSRPLAMRVAGIIPLALDSFIAIIKFSYTLYTVLSTKHVMSETSKMHF